MTSQQPFENESTSGAPVRYRSRPNSRSGSVLSERARELVLAPSALPDDRMMIEALPMPGNGVSRKHPAEKLIRPELRPSSRGSRLSYIGDLMHWPPEETASVVSRTRSLIARRESVMKALSSLAANNNIFGLLSSMLFCALLRSTRAPLRPCSHKTRLVTSTVIDSCTLSRSRIVTAKRLGNGR